MKNATLNLSKATISFSKRDIEAFRPPINPRRPHDTVRVIKLPAYLPLRERGKRVVALGKDGMPISINNKRVHLTERGNSGSRRPRRTYRIRDAFDRLELLNYLDKADSATAVYLAQR